MIHKLYFFLLLIIFLFACFTVRLYCQHRYLPARQFACHKCGAVAVFGLSAHHIGEEKQLQYGEYHNEFDDDNGPQRATYGHAAKSISIESIHLIYNILV